MGPLHSWGKLGITAALLPAENQYQPVVVWPTTTQPQVLQLLLGHHFVYFVFVQKWRSQVWSQNTGTENSVDHIILRRVYTHTHIVAQARLLVVMSRAIWFVNHLVHHSCIGFTRESALFEVTSGLSGFVSDTFFSQQVRVWLKMVLDRTVQRSKLVLHGQEGQQCGADSSLISEGLS